jgi:bifunctional non-homologous end joining protein LigD
MKERRKGARRPKGAEGSARAQGRAQAPLDPAGLPGAQRREQPRSMSPQLARLEESAPEGESWLHEIKLDGYRLLAFVAAGKVRLLTRNGHDWTERFPALVAALAGLPIAECIVDGEVVVLDERGVSSFQDLQNSLEQRRTGRHVFFAFDLPHAGGFDLGATPLEQRKGFLSELLRRGPEDAHLRFSDHVVGDGGLFLRHACELGLEGIVSKRREAPYVERRSASWIKTKCLRRQEFVVGGWTEPGGSREHFGSLLLGTHGADGLRYAGRVGTGFDARSLASMARRLAPLAVREPPFVDPPRGTEARGVHWVAPELVVEVAFTEWTDDAHLRHPTFLGLREDKQAGAVRREQPAKRGPRPS